MNEEIKIECPACKGKGEVEIPIQFANHEAYLRQKAAKTLLANGFGVRQTQRILGYRSPRSVGKIKEEA